VTATHAPITTQPAPALFGRFWRTYLRRHSPMMGLAFIVMTIEGSTLAVLAWALKPLFDRVFVGRDASAIWWVGALIFGLFVIRAVALIINRMLLTRISLATSSAIQTDLLRHILDLDGGFFQTHPPGALMDRVMGDTGAVQAIWSSLILGLGRDVVALVSLFGVAVSIDPWWTIAALGGAPLLILPALGIQRYIRRKTLIVREASGERATRLNEVFHGINAIKLNRMETYQLGRFTSIIDRIIRIEVKTAAIRAAMPALIDIVTGLGFFAVLIFGGKDVIDGSRTVGEFMSFFTAMSLAFQPLRRLGDLVGTWQTAGVSLTRIYELFDRQPTVRSPAHPVAADTTRTDIAICGVNLSYGTHQVLHGLSFTAEAGQTTALVGPSGAGKSTVFNLLTRLIDPDSGRITVGGTEVTRLDLAKLRDLFSVVTQDSALFDETLRDNILVGKTGVPETDIDRAVAAANVRDFVTAFPDGLDSRAGPRGSALSGGQRQRIAIARAVLRNAPILLLDEATSALDAASEALVQDALEKLSHGRTTLVIAHRLATVRNAHKIVVMDHGRVVEEGRHEDLFARNGLYAGLCRLQFSQ
jgi:ATP-binding cassette, subfamily B, bacterial MsbA